MSVTRRSLLKFGAFGIGATAAGLTVPLGQAASTADWISTSAKPKPYTRPLKLPRVLTGVAKTDAYGPYREFVLEEKAANLQILDGTTKTTTPTTRMTGMSRTSRRRMYAIMRDGEKGSQETGRRTPVLPAYRPNTPRSTPLSFSPSPSLPVYSDSHRFQYGTPRSNCGDHPWTLSERKEQIDESPIFTAGTWE